MKVPVLALALALSAMAEPPVRPTDPDGKPVSAARAAELALHRIEKLTVLRVPGGGGKRLLPPTFKLHLTTLDRLALDGEGAYRFEAATTPDREGKRSRIAFALDITGAPVRSNREIADSAMAAGEPAQPFVWPDRNAASLAEEGLHFVIDRAGEVAGLEPYLKDFHSLTIAADTTGAEPQAVIDIRSSSAKDVLRVWIKANGDFLRHRFISAH